MILLTGATGYIGLHTWCALLAAGYEVQVAIGKLDELCVYGGDYPIDDRTGVRDYIHVMDLAQGHVAALSQLFNGGASFTVNLGTGRG